MAQEMKAAMKFLLEEYRLKNGNLPEILVFYRDGVSEGQFAEVQQMEIPQVRALASHFLFFGGGGASPAP
jgi:eukaryotic translation initiation factor 2C